jgi:DNA-binding beta-propeller fold protein YncE
MKKPSLVSKEARSLLMTLFLSGTLAPIAAQIPFTNSVGQIIPLGGHINELALDEARGLAYAGNFSAGTVEVVSLATKRVTARYTTAPIGAATTGMALSPNKKWLVATSFSNESGVAQFRGLMRINLNDPSDRLSVGMANKPLAVAFGADNIAFIVTDTGLVLFNPETGEFRQLLALGESCPTG